MPTTPMVFSSHSSAAACGSRWKRSPSIGTCRASTSQKLQNFSQQTCTFTPMTRLGRTSCAGYRSALRSAQRRFSAIPASMHASLDPVVEQPTTAEGSGACHRSASIATQRRSSSAVRGYSSLSIMFLSRHSLISTPACGSIPGGDEGGQVQPRVAVQHQFVVDQPVRRLRGQRGVGEPVGRRRLRHAAEGFVAPWNGLTASRRRSRSSSWDAWGPGAVACKRR